MRIKVAIASAIVAGLSFTSMSPASAAIENQTGFGYISAELNNGTWTVKVKDNKRDGRCVYAAMTNEDGTILKRSRVSCGRTVTLKMEVQAEDWPRPTIIQTGKDGRREFANNEL